MLLTIGLVATLAAGPNAVGFETLFVRDLSRQAISGQATGRLIQVSIWYPAAPPRADVSQMTHGDYIRLLGRYETEQRGEATDRLGEKRFREATLELANGASTIDQYLDVIARTKTAAIAGAAPAAGRHAIVIFSDHRAPASNSIIAEHLASHGFVVVALPMVGTHELDFDVGVTGIETHLADIRFALDQVARRPYADPTRVAQIGGGIAANVAIAHATRNAGLDAIVSLDGGIISPSEVALTRRTPFFEAAAIRAPMLIVEAPFEGMNPLLMSDYRYADRWFVRFPTMKEFHFRNYGAWEAIAPGLLGAPPPRVQEGFDAAVQHTRAFLDRQLKGKLAEPPAAVEGLYATSFEPALTRVPTRTELKQMIQQRGVNAVRVLYDKVKGSDPQPFSTDALIATANWFAWQKDNDWKIRRTLMEIYVESYPQSARGQFALGNACRAQQDRDCAKRHYSEALRVLADDTDSTMDAAFRDRVRTLSETRLKELS